MSVETTANPRPSFDLEVKMCAEALQSSQKRSRTAFFLSLSACCIIGLMVFNLWESRELRSTELIKNNTPDKSEYLKEFSKHIADDSFYQLPVLGIQITCEDIGFLGPLALLVFSLYSRMAFRACEGQVECATERFAKVSLINTLLKDEMLPDLAKRSYRVLLFLPFIACLGVAWYVVKAHFYALPIADPLRDILMTTRTTALWLDIIGLILAFFVFHHNFQAFRCLNRTRVATELCPEYHSALEQQKSTMAGK